MIPVSQRGKLNTKSEKLVYLKTTYSIKSGVPANIVSDICYICGQINLK